MPGAAHRMVCAIGLVKMTAQICRYQSGSIALERTRESWAHWEKSL